MVSFGSMVIEKNIVWLFMKIKRINQYVGPMCSIYFNRSHAGWLAASSDTGLIGDILRMI